jgi:mediator of RNA polymerase II transcription subunit 6
MMYLQLTAVNSLQMSLDTLRRYRPDFAPRTGFVWPSVDDTDQTTVKDISKTRASSLLPSARQDNQEAQQQQQQQPSSGTGLPLRRKQENFNLMLHAMRTTAAHSRQVFTNQTNDNLLGADPERADAPQRSTPSTTTPGAEALGDSTSRLNATSNKRRKKSL